MNKHKQQVVNECSESYLKDFLNSLNNFSKDLATIREDVLAAKQVDTEDYNGTVPNGQKKKFPRKLNDYENAIILHTLCEFRLLKLGSAKRSGVLAVYLEDKGIYSIEEIDIKKEIRMLAPTANKRECNEVADLLTGLSEAVELTTNSFLVPVKNGILNRNTQCLEHFDSEYAFLTKLAVKYEENVQKPIITMPDGMLWDIDSWVRDLANQDPEVEYLLWQVIVDCILTNYSSKKAILFYSRQGNNGKGTFGQMIKNILGKGNYSSLSVVSFKHNFLPSLLFGVGANISDENPVGQYIDSVRDFKASVTGDDIIINPKNRQPFPFQFNGANIQMFNELPKVKDKSDSFYRRIILVPFITSFTNNGERTYIKNDYIHRTEVLEYVLKKALEMDFDEYIVPQISQELLGEFKEDNNPVLQFWKELEPELKWDLIPIAFLYDLYVSWTKKTNPSGRPASKKVFKEDITKLLEDSDSWFFKDMPVYTGMKMDVDEPLITEYGLIDWMDRQAASLAPPQQRSFVRANTYRSCLVRL
jgi:putative DNA primase/helicase